MASRVRVRGCGRCGGDQYLDTYEQPHDWACLQCGARTAVVVHLRQPVVASEARGRRHYPAANLRSA